MEIAEYLLESLAMVLDDTHYSRERGPFAGVEIVDQAVRRHVRESSPVYAT